MPLMQTEDGSWIDPSTIAAVRLAGDESPAIVVDRFPPFHVLRIKCKSMECAESGMNNLARARNNAKRAASGD